jgi:hypothetical protein
MVAIYPDRAGHRWRIRRGGSDRARLRAPEIDGRLLPISQTRRASVSRGSFPAKDLLLTLLMFEFCEKTRHRRYTALSISITTRIRPGFLLGFATVNPACDRKSSRTDGSTSRGFYRRLVNLKAMIT